MECGSGDRWRYARETGGRHEGLEGGQAELEAEVGAAQTVQQGADLGGGGVEEGRGEEAQESRSTTTRIPL